MPETVGKTEAQLRSAFEVATRDVNPEALDVVLDVDVPGRVGVVQITDAGGALVLNDENASDTIDEALANYGWETAVARVTGDGVSVSVWEADDAE